MFNLPEATARWRRVADMMTSLDLDMLLAIDLSRDEILLGHQRWLTCFIPVGGPAAVLFHRGGAIELISERIGRPVADHYQREGIPIELVNGYSTSLICERIARHKPRRIGLAEPATVSWRLGMLLREQSPDTETVDVSPAMEKLRMRKSPFELDLVRKSCSIADAVWQHVPDIFKVGRRNFEIVADIDHLARSQGAESGFHLVLRLPFLGRPMNSVANAERIEANARYLVEISPRYQGYYAQVTVPVTTHPRDEPTLRAYNDIVDAKQAALPRLRAGADLSEVARYVQAFLSQRDRKMASLSLGHFCGMALEEPRHDPALPRLLEEGMTLIFHPVLSDPELHSLMRADTYLITATGAQSLNRHDQGLLFVS